MAFQQQARSRSPLTPQHARGGSSNSGGVQQGPYRPGTAGSVRSASTDGRSSPCPRRALVSIESFDPHSSVCSINSPRSLAALSRLGLTPGELLCRPRSHRSFVEGVDQQTAELLPDYVERRWAHYEQKRQAKVEAVREERAWVIQQEEHGGSNGGLIAASSAHHGSNSSLVSAARTRASSALELEKEELARMQSRLLAKLNQSLSHEIRRAQALDRAQSKVEYAQARVENERAHRAQVQAERDAQAKAAVEEQQRRLAFEAEQRRRAHESAWEEQQRQTAERLEAERLAKQRAREAQADLRNRAEEQRAQLESIQAFQRSQIEEREAELARKEAQRAHNAEMQRRLHAEIHAEQQRALQDRLDQAAARQAQLAEEKRQRFLEKESLAQQKREQFEAERQWEREQARLRAEQHEERLRQAQAQAESLRAQKAQRALEKEQQAADRLAERERVRAMDEHERRAWLAEREAMRRQILEHSYVAQEVRGAEILRQRASKNARSEGALRERERRIRERQLAEQLLAADRKEQVERMARIQESQRQSLLARIQSDRERIDALQQQSATLGAQRMKLRDMAKRKEQQVLQRFQNLAAHPERLRGMDPNQVDVLRMGLLSQEEARELLSFNDPSAYDDYDDDEADAHEADLQSHPLPPHPPMARPASAAAHHRRRTSGNSSSTSTPTAKQGRHQRSVSHAQPPHARAHSSTRPSLASTGSPYQQQLTLPPRPSTASVGRDRSTPRSRDQAPAPAAAPTHAPDFGQPSQAFQEYAQTLQTH